MTGCVHRWVLVALRIGGKVAWVCRCADCRGLRPASLGERAQGLAELAAGRVE